MPSARTPSSEIGPVAVGVSSVHADREADTHRRPDGMEEKPVDVLVVDDDFDLRDTLKEILQDFGYEVAVASDGSEALSWLRSHELPRLVLLDWMMPVCDGASFRAAQLEDERLAPVPVVLLTADIRLDEKTKALNANAYVKKPVELDTLVETIRLHSRH